VALGQEKYHFTKKPLITIPSSDSPIRGGLLPLAQPNSVALRTRSQNPTLLPFHHVTSPPVIEEHWIALLCMSNNMFARHTLHVPVPCNNDLSRRAQKQLTVCHRMSKWIACGTSSAMTQRADLVGYFKEYKVFVSRGHLNELAASYRFEKFHTVSRFCESRSQYTNQGIPRQNTSRKFAPSFKISLQPLEVICASRIVPSRLYESKVTIHKHTPHVNRPWLQ
jgi:hypothetical protein